MTDTTTTWLTQEAYDRLSAELEELSGPARVDIAKKIEAAREEGDLKENGGYHAAKDEQGKIEARIRQLTQLLRNATVGEAPTSHGVVEIGTVVTAKITGDETTFLLGSRELLRSQGVRISRGAHAWVRRLQKAAETPLLLAVDGRLTGLIGLRDTVRPESAAVLAALRADGKDATLYEYPGEDHRFGRSWPLFMHRAGTFLHQQLGR